MTFEQLEFIVEVKRRGTILAAANSLNLSHTGIGKAITILEAELGVNIFLRTRGGTTVTPEGEKIIQMAIELLEKAEQLKQWSGSTLTSGTLHLEAFPIDSMPFLPKVISEFRARYSNVELMISQAKLSDIITNLNEQKIDLGLLALMQFQRAQLSPDILYKTLFTSQMAVACSPRSPIASQSHVTPEELMEYPFVLHDDTLILKNLETLFAPMALPKALVKTNNSALIKQMVVDGRALSIYTMVLEESEPLVKQGELVLVPLKCIDDTQRIDFVYAYNQKKRLSLSDKAFISCLKAATAQAQ